LFISIILALGAAYFAYSSINFLSMTPFAQWTAAHLVIAALTAILAGFAVFFCIRAWKLWKRKAATINEQMEKEQAKLREKKRAVYMEDYENPAPDEEIETAVANAEADENESKM
jgi:membrane-bound ClpP family serine protease